MDLTKYNVKIMLAKPKVYDMQFMNLGMDLLLKYRNFSISSLALR